MWILKTRGLIFVRNTKYFSDTYVLFLPVPRVPVCKCSNKIYTLNDYLNFYASLPFSCCIVIRKHAISTTLTLNIHANCSRVGATYIETLAAVYKTRIYHFDSWTLRPAEFKFVYVNRLIIYAFVDCIMNAVAACFRIVLLFFEISRKSDRGAAIYARRESATGVCFVRAKKFRKQLLLR